MIYGLTYLGVFHTIISFIALFSGVIALLRDKKITYSNTIGKVYVISTIIVCITGFGIFEHGGFGKPHQLGIITLVTLVFIYLANQKKLGSRSAYIEMALYTLTLFFHFVPTITEGLTRLPYGAAFASSPDDPTIQKIIGGFLLLFIVIIVLQLRDLKKRSPVH